ncbi:MAG: peptide deformylase [candidate division NC10 bacterium]|nr:peptide deformylase [candidate division NC10 bacterium]
MALLKVAQLGHPILRRRAASVPQDTLRSRDFQRFVDDLIETMREYSGVGLAAPQVHESLQVFVVEAQKRQQEETPITPLTVFVNPVVTPLGDDLLEEWEGCLSIPGLRGKVLRHREVRVEALDRRGKPLDFTATDFLSRVIQHENDHIQGIVFLDRMKSFESLAYLEEYARYWAEK